MFSPAAYLRVYEPLTAFSGPERRRWAAYAASADRPRRAGALAAETSGALRRLLSAPPVAAPDRESGDAYVRWVQGVTYICPWQTRLRSWLAIARLGATSPALLAAAFPAGRADAAAVDFGRWKGAGPSLRVYIQVSAWSVPWEWFVPFAAQERWLVLGAPGDGGDGVRATVSATRTLVYATQMSRARERVAQALSAFRRARSDPGGCARHGRGGGARGDRGSAGAARGAGAGGGTGGRLTQRDAWPGTVTGLEEVGRWLEEFHPGALVELDYGGLVHLLDDTALKADQSAAEVSTAISAFATGELELATAMHRRLARRWGPLCALGAAS